MRLPLLFVPVFYLTSVVAAAQQSGDLTTAEQKDVGRLKVRIVTDQQALGVIAQLSRSSFAQTVECNGICYSPNFSKSITWTCAPQKTCDLHCAEAHPIGNCE
jgi:hypothetical protein